MKSTLHQTVAALALALTTAWMSASALASPPYVNYQGTINDSAGNPINNNSQSLQFNIYDAATGGNLVWGPFNVTAPVLNGRFNVILGPNDTASRSLDAVFVNSNDRYLSVTVGGTTIDPRQRFLANPYAYAASSVTNARCEISPSRFAVLANNALELGGGIAGKAAGNGNVSYGNNSLDVVGGGTSTANRLTTVYGNLVVTNAGTTVSLTVNGTVKATSLTVLADNRVVSASSLADLTAALGGTRIVRGRVSSTGSILDGAGTFTISAPISSSYTLTFTPPFSGTPVVTATAVPRSLATPGVVNSSNPTATGVTINTWYGTDRGDLEFSFIAIGPR